MLQFLADESCDFSIVRALRDDGYDVIAVSEIMQRSDDRELVVSAHQADRVLLTEDKDFGWYVYVGHENSPGVILIRFPGNARSTLPSSIRNVVKEHGEKLKGMFVVVQPGLVRIGGSRN